MANPLVSNPAPEAPHCLACQALLTDALDGSLGEIDQAWFDHHVRSCAECGSLFADAQRGAAWLDLLKSAPPEPSADLIGRILAQTSVAPAPQPAFVPVAYVSAVVLPFPSRPARPSAPWMQLPAALFEPRLALTAAMALFSLALTMNLTGIQLGQLRPSNLRRTYYQSAAGAARYYDNLRVVRVLESRVEDLREENSGSDTGAQPSPKAAPTPAKPNHGVSRREAPVVIPADRRKPLYAQASSWTTGGLV